MKANWKSLTVICATVCISLSKLHAQDARAPDGWGEFKFGMNKLQVDQIMKKNGNVYTIDNMSWSVSVLFANLMKVVDNKIVVNDDPTAGNLDDITLTTPGDVYPCYPDQIVDDLENHYGTFEITRDSPQAILGTRSEPYAVKHMGRVTITFNFQQYLVMDASGGGWHWSPTNLRAGNSGMYNSPPPQPRVLGLKCMSPSISYHMDGLEIAILPPTPPHRGQF